jgi:hypothetical protein
MISADWTAGNFFIFLLYIAASVQSWRTGPNAAKRSNREDSIWIIAACLFCAMAANIALGALDKLTNAARSGFRAEGWYPNRMALQLDVMIGILVVAAMVVLLALFRLRALPTSTRLTLVALLALMTFLLVRAVSLHAVDQFLFARIAGVTISTAMEAGFVTLILLLISWRRAGLAPEMPRRSSNTP